MTFALTSYSPPTDVSFWTTIADRCRTNHDWLYNFYIPWQLFFLHQLPTEPNSLQSSLNDFVCKHNLKKQKQKNLNFKNINTRLKQKSITTVTRNFKHTRNQIRTI